MKGFSLAGALTAGLIGAIVWALIAHFTGYEIGYVAWAIGGMVGFASASLGGRGKSSALACAAIAVGAILLGKVLHIQFLVSREIDQELRNGYQGLAADAADFAGVHGEGEYPEFMRTHGYSTAKKASDIHAEELEEFKNESVPKLKEFQSSRPSYEVWLKEPGTLLYKQTVRDLMPLSKLLAESLTPFSIIFALLGIGTAYRVGMGKNPTAPSRPAPEPPPLQPPPPPAG